MKRAFLAMSLGAVASLAALAEDGKFEFGGCHVQWSGKSLTVGNRHFRRAYEISDGVLRTTSFAATGGVEWQKRGADAAGAIELDVEVARAKWSPVGVEGVRIDVKAKASGLRCAELWLFPEMPGVLLAQRHGTLTELKPVHDFDRKWETLYKDNAMLGKARKQCDFIAFKPMHVKAVDITCLDQTEKPLHRQGKHDAEKRDLFMLSCIIEDKMVKIKVSQTALHIDVEKAVGENLFHIRFLLQFIVEDLGPERRRNTV